MLAAAVAPASLRPAASTRGAGDHAAAGPAVLPGEPRCAAGDGRCAARETFGTAVEFVRGPGEAARIADQQHKLLFLLHVSGNFDDTGFT